MISIKFPDMFNRTITQTTDTDYDSTLQNLKMLLWSEKGSLFGDPYYGAGLKRYLFDLNDTILKNIVVDYVYTAIADFMPQLKVDRKDITITMQRNLFNITISALNKVNFKTDLYNIVLLQQSVL